MNKLEFKGLGTYLYHEKMKNGLDVYVIPNKEVSTNFAMFSTKYGNRINEFIPVGESNFKKYPAGIAHFLEHKVFETEDGVDPFTFFGSHGADCNAFTNNDMTCYYFEGMDYFKENLEYLLDFVQSIHLTDENVEKEKGIIIEEAMMGLDNLGRIMHNATGEMAFNNDPRKYKVIGELDEIKSITKEQLLECYNTFYHPSNMNLIVSGNVDYEEVFEIVRKNQAKKGYKEIDFPKVKKVEEQKNLANYQMNLTGNTSIPYIAYVIKLDLRDLDYDTCEKVSFIDGILYSLFSETTGFGDMLRKKKIINGYVNRTMSYDNDFCILRISTKTKKIKEFFEEIEKHFKNYKPDEETFERFKKVIISSYIRGSDNPYNMAHTVREDLYYTGEVGINDFQKFKNFTFDDYQSFVKQLDFSECGKIVINPKDVK